MTDDTPSRTSPSIVGRSLLVTNDIVILEQLKIAIQQFAISVDTCPDAITAAGLINTRKFEAILVDLAAGERVTEVLERVRVSPSNQNSITFGIVGPGEDSGRKPQCNFVIHKPLNEGAMISTLRAALGLIIHDYRRYFRCPVIVPVVMSVGNDETIDCEMMNISEGGLAVKTVAELSPGMTVRTNFVLPGEVASFELHGEICWCDKRSRAGLHFRSMSEDQKRRLQVWLSRRIEESIPQPVARLFQQHSGCVNQTAPNQE